MKESLTDKLTDHLGAITLTLSMPLLAVPLSFYLSRIDKERSFKGELKAYWRMMTKIPVQDFYRFLLDRKGENYAPEFCEKYKGLLTNA